MQPIVRIYHDNGLTIDCHTGIAAATMPNLAPMLKCALPLPDDLS